MSGEEYGELKPRKTMFILSCVSLVISNIFSLICVCIIFITRTKRPPFINLFLLSQYIFFIITFTLYMTAKCMVDYEIGNGREKSNETVYGVIGCMIYFLWSAVSFNALGAMFLVRTKTLWKRKWNVLSVLLQGIFVIVVPGTLIGLCIHFNEDGLESFGALVDAYPYLEGSKWTWDFNQFSEYVNVMYIAITFSIFLLIGGVFFFQMVRRIWKGIRVKDMGVPGIFPDQILSHSEVDMFKGKITFIPMGFYLLTGYLFIVSQISNDYESMEQVYFLIPLSFLFLFNLYLIYLSFTLTLRQFEVPLLPGIQTIGRPIITKLPTLSESTERSIAKYFSPPRGSASDSVELKGITHISESTHHKGTSSDF